MSYEDRKALIESIQEKNNSKILTYFLSDRGVIPGNIPLPTKTNIAQDAKEIIYNSLKAIGHQQRLDLFIYCRGGDTNAVWPIVSLIREFCSEFVVLVPFRNHSAGTMISLGADKIIMSKIGELSPIDPTTGNQFNPVDELMKGNRRGISVEDLNSYLQLAEDKFKLRDNQILDVFKELTREVHPLALGNVNRVLSQSKLLSKKLLSLHLDKEKDQTRIDSITKGLTAGFHSHLHFINRKEALEMLGKKMVINPDEQLEEMMIALYDSYADALDMRNEFCCFSEMADQHQREFDLYSGLVETDITSYIFKTHLLINQKSEIPPNINVTLQPGQVRAPIVQGLPKSFSWEVHFQSWVENQQEV